LATIGLSVKHDLEFWDVDFTTDDKVQKNETDPGANMTLLGSGEHYGMSEIAWDPSGRYLTSEASAFRNSVSCFPAEVERRADKYRVAARTWIHYLGLQGYRPLPKPA
jgi:uncharacterized protein with WD repeat